MNAEAFTFREFVRLIRRHLRLVLAFLILALGLCGIALFAISPLYSTSALILVDPAGRDVLTSTPENSSNPLADEARVASEVALVETEGNLHQVIEQLGLMNNPEFEPRLGWRESLLTMLKISEPDLPSGAAALQDVTDRLAAAVAAKRQEGSFLIEVQARAQSPELAAAIANALANAYVAAQTQSKVASVLRSRDIVQGRLDAARDTMVSTEQGFDDFLNSNLDRIADATGRTDLATVRQQLLAATNDQARLATQVQDAERDLQSGNFAALSERLESQALQQLQQQRQAILSKLADQVDQTQVDLRTELARINSSLESQGKEAVATLKQQVVNAEQKAEDVRATLRNTIINGDLPPDVLTSIYTMQQSSQIARAQYQALLQRAQDLETQAFLQVADSRLAADAPVPSRASFPNPPLFLSLASLAGIAAGIGLALGLEYFFGGITSEDQMQALLRVPRTVTVPRTVKLPKLVDKAVPNTPASLPTVAPLSAYSEAIRRIQLELDQLVRGRELAGVVLMVTSTQPQEGKSTIALSLARSYEQSGKKVMLIDCDLRKPSIHTLLGLPPSKGLLELLRESPSSDAVAKFATKDPLSDLMVIPGARPGSSPTDRLVSSESFKSLIRNARASFELIVLDTPPIGAVVDGLYIAEVADAALFVVKAGSTGQSDAMRNVASLIGAMSSSELVVGILNQQEQISARKNKYTEYYLDE